MYFERYYHRVITLIIVIVDDGDELEAQCYRSTLRPKWMQSSNMRFHLLLLIEYQNKSLTTPTYICDLKNVLTLNYDEWKVLYFEKKKNRRASKHAQHVCIETNIYTCARARTWCCLVLCNFLNIELHTAPHRVV